MDKIAENTIIPISTEPESAIPGVQDDTLHPDVPTLPNNESPTPLWRESSRVLHWGAHRIWTNDLFVTENTQISVGKKERDVKNETGIIQTSHFNTALNVNVQA